jgi:hypothetical protein
MSSESLTKKIPEFSQLKTLTDGRKHCAINELLPLSVSKCSLSALQESAVIGAGEGESPSLQLKGF